jgi:hypothetical protein
MAHLSSPAILIGQFSQVSENTKLLRTVEELKFPAKNIEMSYKKLQLLILAIHQTL